MKIYNLNLCCLFLWLLLPLSPHARCQAEDIPKILVSVAPHAFMVEQIAGDTVDVMLMVPAGASAHTFEPSPSLMIRASHATLWFRMGESFETKAIRSILSFNPLMEIVDLRKGLDLIKGDADHSACKHCGMEDLHFWLSPSMDKIQAKTIFETLKRLYPEHTAKYKENFDHFLGELDALDHKIHAILDPLKVRTILVSHPSYGYFSREYDLTQWSIEFEGKDPTPRQLNELMQKIKASSIKRVFIQKQYHNKGAKLIADTFGLKVVMLDPYAPDVLQSMVDIAQAFSQNGSP